MIVLLGSLAIVLGALYLMQRRLIYFPSRLSRAEFSATVSGTFGAGAAGTARPADAVYESGGDSGPRLPVSAGALPPAGSLRFSRRIGALWRRRRDSRRRQRPGRRRRTGPGAGADLTRARRDAAR